MAGAWKANGPLTGDSGGAGVSVPWPTHAAGDWAILIVSRIDVASRPAATLATAAGFSLVGYSEAVVGGIYVNQTIFWNFATSGAMAQPATNTSSYGGANQIVTYTGLVNQAPEVSSFIGGTTNAMSISGAGPTHTAGDLVVAIASQFSSSASDSVTGWANTSLTAVAERVDNYYPMTNLGAQPINLALADGQFATATTYNPTTATWSGVTYTGWAGATLALKATPTFAASTHVAIEGDSIGLGQASTDHADQGFSILTANMNAQINATYAVSIPDPPTMINFGTTAVAPYATGSVPGYGFEITMCREMNAIGGALATPFVSKFALNGTTATDYEASSMYPSTGGNLQARSFAFFDARIAECGRPIDVWVLSLGTNDASTAPLAAAFPTKIASIVAARRARYGAGLIVVMCLVNAASTQPYAAPIRAAQIAFAASDPLCILINSDDTAVPDGLHPASDECITIGQRIAYAVADRRGIPRPTVAAGAPQWVGSEPVAFGNAALTPRSPACEVDGDGEILQVTSGLVDVPVTLSTPAGFAQIGNQVVSSFSTLRQRIAWFFRRVVASQFVNGRMPNPVVANPTAPATTNFNSAVIHTFRGNGYVVVDELATPSANNNFNTSLTITGLTTNGTDRLIAMFAGGYTNQNNAISTANAALASVAIRRAGLYTIGSDYQLSSLATGVLSAQGITGSATTTTTQTAILAGLQAALTTTPFPSAISVVPTIGQCFIGGTKQFTATAIMPDGTTADVTATAVWSSSNPAAATVALGLASGVSIGGTIITATIGGFSDTSLLTVLVNAGAAGDLADQQSAMFGEDIWYDVSNPDDQGYANLIVDAGGDWQDVTGIEALRQSLLRRLITSPGEWQTVPDYGVGARQYIKAPMTPSTISELESRIRSQYLRDDRVESIHSITITPLTGDQPGIYVLVNVIPKGRLRQDATLPVAITIT